MAQTKEEHRLKIVVHNIGGIEACEVTFDPGVTILVGQNATNRTSLLEAISSGLGGTTGQLKSDSDSGEIALTLDGKSFERHYHRRDEVVITEGDERVDDKCIIDLFVSLLESNDIRRAIEYEGDLRSILMRPINVQAIQQRIADCKEKQRKIDSQLEALEDKKSRLTELETKKTAHYKRKDEIESQLENLRVKAKSIDKDVSQEESDEKVAQLRDEIQEYREELDRIDHQINVQEDAIEALKSEQAEYETELKELSEPEHDPSELSSRLTTLQERRQTLNVTVNELTSIVDFNERVVEQDFEQLAFDEFIESDITTRLNPSSETIECWTCGTQVERIKITRRLKELRNLVSKKQDEVQDLNSEIETLRKQKKEVERLKERRKELKSDMDDIESEMTDRRNQLVSLREKRASVEEELSQSEQEMAEMRNDIDEETRSIYQEINSLEYERGRIESSLSEIESEIEEINANIEEEDELRDKRAELVQKVQSLRSRIRDMEKDIVETFNDEIETILNILKYENIERVWIEHHRDETASDLESGDFELNIVRKNDSGSVYQGSISNLSESEREVIGLTVALAGYLTYDVAEECPVLLLDSLEAIDSIRIDRLLSYFKNRVRYLIVALLPSDAEVVDNEYRRIPASEIT